MNLSPQSQALTFLLCLGAGLGLGFLYDVLRFFRLLFRRLGGILDLTFWVAALTLLFLCCNVLEDGQIRLYVAAGLGLGAAGYFALLSPPVRFLLERLFRLLRWLAGLVWRPVRTVFRILSAPLAKFFHRVKLSWKKTFSFSQKWSRIISLVHTRPPRGPREQETEAQQLVYKKGWSSWEDFADPGSDLCHREPGQCPSEDRPGPG